MLNKISLYQLLAIALFGFMFLFLNKPTFFTAFLISALVTSSYTQLIRLSSLNKIFALYGFPIRILLVAPPAAILVHKLNSNLLALFIGFVLGQLIYIVLIWFYTKEQRFEI